MRFRYVYMGIFSILALLTAFLVDPDLGFIQELSYGAGFVATISHLTKITILIAMLHLSRRALFDYLDLEEYFLKAKETPEGAAQALISIGLWAIAIATLIAAVL